MTSRALPLPADILPESAHLDERGRLCLGGLALEDLARDFGTPLYVYDEATLRSRARAYRDSLAAAYPGLTRVCYAAKAYCAPWLLRLLAEEGLGLDVVSGGELFTALRAAFPLERVYFHGNNKTDEELALALHSAIGQVVVDNLEEVGRLARLAAASGVRQRVLLRVTPGVEAHTHEFIKTGVLDTKFGLSIATGAAEAGARAILAEPSLDLVGLHCHIGSQIFGLDAHREAVERVVGFAARLRDDASLDLRELSPGGGFGMRYTEADEPPAPADAARAVAEAVLAALRRHGFVGPLPTLAIEPGRSIVGPSAVALYRVGSVKDIPGVRTYVAVDGGIADNVRPAMYGALYTPLLANRPLDPPDGAYTVAGRYCESGDVLVRAARLPRPRVGDLLVLPGSGAYHLAMASNYNLVPRPAVVVVAEGRARLVRRRETYEDLLRPEL